MTFLPQEELRKTFSLAGTPDELDESAQGLRKRAAEEFRSQLVLGAPNNADEAGLRRLSAQLESMVAAAIIFAEFLFQPTLSLRVNDSTQRDNLMWMIIIGIAASGLLGVHPKTPGDVGNPGGTPGI